MTACCTPRRFAGPTGVRLRHTCKTRYGQAFDGERRKTEALNEVHRIEDARAGIATGSPTKPAEADALPISCEWHERMGIEYTVSGICNGPACVAYLEAHSDDLTGVR